MITVAFSLTASGYWTSQSSSIRSSANHTQPDIHQRQISTLTQLGQDKLTENTTSSDQFPTWVLSVLFNGATNVRNQKL